jgi:hypothetical protein
MTDTSQHQTHAFFFKHCTRNFVGIRLHGLLWCRQAAYDFSLALARNLAVAQKSRQNFFVPVFEKLATPVQPRIE